jgi:hypothetical protein
MINDNDNDDDEHHIGEESCSESLGGCVFGGKLDSNLK